MTLVWDNFNQGASEKLCMLKLADWSDDEGGHIYPSINKLSKKINLSESQTRRIVHNLIAKGFLSVTANHFGGDPGKPRNYKINLNTINTPSMDATPSIGATPSMGARDPLHGCALPLAPMQAYTSISVNKRQRGGNAKKTPLKKSPVKKPIFVPPTLQDVIDYVNEKNYSIDPVYFFSFYNEADWVDSKGDKVKNWKQKLITWANIDKKQPEQPQRTRKVI